MPDRRRAREQILDVSIGAPQEWRTNARNRWHVRGKHAKQLSKEAGRRPTSHADPASGPAHSHQLPRSLLVVGREHDAECGEHHVETRGWIRQRLGVRHLKGDVEAFRFDATSPTLEERRHIIGGRDARKAACRGQRRVAVACGHVEHPLARANVHGLIQELAHDLKRGADHCIVAGPPHGLLPGLD